ncbi:hypothetical protein RRG08_022800 [Elysia crispata]|uniref:PiggyBac transposable element-derived protein domain-containing protein n=1 Tax=Elysia crispata TaxID=231223 RepID=A0AAE1D8C5_9GAST|nr:hypothetical protein RRG08_022800 [Elysia crispata]
MASPRSKSTREKRTVRPPKRFRTEEVLDFLDESDDNCGGGLADSSDSYSESDRSSDSETEITQETTQPSTSSSTSSSGSTSANSSPPSARSTSTDAGWTEATQGEATENQFRFLPKRPPGVQPGYLPENCSAVQAFLCLFTVNIIDSLVNSINRYADIRCQQNNPSRKRSRFASWTPVTRAELYKFFAVMTLINGT